MKATLAIGESQNNNSEPKLLGMAKPAFRGKTFGFMKEILL